MATELLLHTTPDTVVHVDGREQHINRVIGVEFEDGAADIADIPRSQAKTEQGLIVPHFFARRLIRASGALPNIGCHQFAAYMRIGVMLDREEGQAVAYDLVLPGLRFDSQISQSFPPGSQEVIVRTGPDDTNDENDVYHSMTALGQNDMRLHVPGPGLGLAYDRVGDIRGFYQNILGDMACYATTTVITR